MHSPYFMGLLENSSSWPKDTQNLQQLAVGAATKQEHLHTIVEGLYAKRILLNAFNIESVLRCADYLGIRCIVEACETYILNHILFEAPKGVRLHLPPLS